MLDSFGANEEGTDAIAFGREAGSRARAKPALPSQEHEAGLIARVCEGNNESFYELIRPYQRVVYLTALSVVKNETEAEEIAQEAIFKAFKGLRSFRGDARFSTWLVQITVNEGRLYLRRRKRAALESLDSGTENEDGEHVPVDCADWREIPIEALERKELRQALARAVDRLKPIYRDVFVLRDINHLNVAETAQALGISEASVKTRLLRARLQLRDALAPGWDGSWNSGSTSYKRVRPF